MIKLGSLDTKINVDLKTEENNYKVKQYTVIQGKLELKFASGVQRM